MDIWQILMTPFSWLLKLFCDVFNSYGIALFLFTVVVKIVLFPLNLKGKKGMIKMNVTNAQVQEIQKRCGNDKEKYNQELQKFYTENNVNPMGGCGWQMVPLIVLYPLYAIIRRPLKYMMWLTEDAVKAVAAAVGWAAAQGSEFTIGGSNELILASMLNAGNLEAAKSAAATAGVDAGSMFVINFNFFGIDLSLVPKLNFWADGISRATFGLFLLPVISAVVSVLSSLVLQKTNQMNKDQPAPKMNWSIMLMAPLMSLWIGFAMPAGMCIYWIANSALGIIQEVICGRMLRKDYEEAQREMAEQAAKAKEAEKERRRAAAEKKAAAIAAGKDPRKNKQKKKQEPGVDLSASREGLRAYARGRAYDPNRYPSTPYWDPDSRSKPKVEPEEEPKELTEEEKEIVAQSNPELLAQAEKAEQAAAEPSAEDSGEEGGYEEAYAEDDEEQ